MKNNESLTKKEEEKFVPYILTKEQQNTNPNGLWENFLNGAITTIKNSIQEKDMEEGILRAKLARAIKDDLSRDRQGFVTVDEILLMGLRNSDYERGGFWDKKEEKWENLYKALQEKTKGKESVAQEKENSAQKKERGVIMSEIEQELAKKDWDSVGDYIEESLKIVPGLGGAEYNTLREDLWKKFSAMQSA